MVAPSGHDGGRCDVLLTFRPIKVWPEGWRERTSRPSTPFRSNHRDTLGLLGRELAHLGTREATLQVDASERDCRLDGQLRADAKVRHPGVILTIETREHGTQVYATDRFEGWGGHPGWQANLRAIALGLEALRKVERYGIAERGQQYAGYREIGSGGIELGAAMTLDEAAALLMPEDPSWLLEVGTRDDIAGQYRWLAMTHHPDAGGDPELFRRITEARDLLVAHLG